MLTAAEASALAVDRPFAPPLECVMDLPFPPSVNRIWRVTGGKSHVTLSGKYKNWMDQANMAVIANSTWRRKQRMPGAFTALILLNRDHRQKASDVDNRIKAVLDWAQRVELVTDDKLCEEVTARWAPASDAPAGCRLILRSVTP